MTASDSSIATARHAAKAAAEKIAQDIVALDVSERLALADVFLIASAPSERQVNAIVDGIEDELSKQDLRPVRREGRSGGRWVLLDYSDIVIHVQHEEDRVFYALERLWKDCPVVDLQLGRRHVSQGACSFRNRVASRNCAKTARVRICPIWNFRKCCSKIFELLRGNTGAVKKSGAVAQLVAHLHGMQGVRGSSPLSSPY